MLKELKSVVYRLYFPGLDRCYIGKSRVPEMRFKQHWGKLQRGSHENVLMQNDYNKHKVKPVLEILIEVPLCIVDMVEDFYIQRHTDYCYNIKGNKNNMSICKNKYTDIEILTNKKRRY